MCTQYNSLSDTVRLSPRNIWFGRDMRSLRVAFEHSNVLNILEIFPCFYTFLHCTFSLWSIRLEDETIEFSSCARVAKCYHAIEIFIIAPTACTCMRGSRRGWHGVRTPLWKITKMPAFNVGLSSARQRNAIKLNGPLCGILNPRYPHQLKKQTKKNSQSWTPSDKIFWIRTCTCNECAHYQLYLKIALQVQTCCKMQQNNVRRWCTAKNKPLLALFVSFTPFQRLVFTIIALSIGFEHKHCRYMTNRFCPASKEWQWRIDLFTKLSGTCNW